MSHDPFQRRRPKAIAMSQTAKEASAAVMIRIAALGAAAAAIWEMSWLVRLAYHSAQ